VAKDHPLVRGKTIDEWAVDWASRGTSVGPPWRFYRQLALCRQHCQRRLPPNGTAAAATARQTAGDAAAAYDHVDDNDEDDEDDGGGPGGGHVGDEGGGLGRGGSGAERAARRGSTRCLEVANRSPLVLLEYTALCKDLLGHAQRLACWLGGGAAVAPAAANTTSGSSSTVVATTNSSSDTSETRLDFNSSSGSSSSSSNDIVQRITAADNVARAAALCSRDAMACAVTQFDDHWLYVRQVGDCAHRTHAHTHARTLFDARVVVVGGWVGWVVGASRSTVLRADNCAEPVACCLPLLRLLEVSPLRAVACVRTNIDASSRTHTRTHPITQIPPCRSRLFRFACCG
jgi:hypothetical protein